MDLSFNIETALHALQKVCPLSERRQTLPILNSVKIEFLDGEARFTGTDMESELTITVANANGTGAVAIGARKFLDIIKAAKEYQELRLTIDSDRVIAKAGRGRYVLASLPVGDFPSLEVGTGKVNWQMSQGTLKRLINRTAFAMATQDVRFYLIGMLFELSGHTFRAVATDGHRLAANSTLLDQEFPENTRVIVPRRTIMELERLLSNGTENLHISLSDSTIRFSGHDWSFVSKLIDGRYPDYERVIPNGAMRRASVDRDALRVALQRVGALLEGRQFPVEWMVSKNNLKLVIKNEGEEAEDEVDIQYEGTALSVIYKFNYVLDMLNALDAGTLDIWMVDASQAMKIEQPHDMEKGVYVLMPMKA